MTWSDTGPILFIDDDAVVLDRCRPGDRPPVNTANVGTVQIENPMLRDPIQIIYSRPAVAFINQAAAAYEVQWLTGLSVWVPKVLAPAIGLDRFESAFQYAFEADADVDPIGDGSQWWKDLVVRTTIDNTSRRIAWVDDQITRSVKRRMTTDFGESRTFLVPIVRGSRMTEHDMVKIADFVGAHRDAR